ncbi:MAG: bifunctional glutamate N-acetyltransferase/amino-acid acetyltransferase ArgJ [Candidatus Melainabacteria bacterium]|nr:bifunctional glutamate N-acetyltransferase/amino-acid acetyltransferase ArgJ [Candidatus Melainabacteria bacterium]
MKLKIAIYPIVEGMSGDYQIADHINLSSKAPALGFNPITDLYKDKNNPDAIIVACLKAGTRPNEEEIKVLQANGVKAYCYDLAEPVLYAAARNETVEAIGFVPKLPEAFEFYATSSGMKADSSKLDLAIAVSKVPCYYAASFTNNKVRAACVENNLAIYNSGKAVRALIANSGNANACTGTQGDLNDQKLRQAIASRFNIEPSEVLTASTGKIGVQLEIEQMLTRIKEAPQAQALDFAEAILTTDLVSKVYQSKNILGISKGSGMIHPNMKQATMLAFLFTDCKLKAFAGDEMQAKFRDCLQQAIELSFNSISVDGDTSTNDMVILVSSGQGPEIEAESFQDQLNQVCTELAKKIVLDGEGTTKLVELELEGLGNNELARKVARQVLNSALVKTAIFGNDPNWGRLVAALGQALAEHGLDADLNQVSLELLRQKLYQDAMPTEFDRDKLIAAMKQNKTISIKFKLAEGESVKVWSSDLSYDYVRINAEYFT